MTAMRLRAGSWRRIRLLVLLLAVLLECAALIAFLDTSTYWRVNDRMVAAIPWAYSPGDVGEEQIAKTTLYLFLGLVFVNSLLFLPMGRKRLLATLISDLETVPRTAERRWNLLFAPRNFLSPLVGYAIPLLGCVTLDFRLSSDPPLVFVSCWFPILAWICFVLADRALVLGTVTPGRASLFKLAAVGTLPLAYFYWIPCFLIFFSLVGLFLYLAGCVRQGLFAAR